MIALTRLDFISPSRADVGPDHPSSGGADPDHHGPAEASPRDRGPTDTSTLDYRPGEADPYHPSPAGTEPHDHGPTDAGRDFGSAGVDPDHHGATSELPVADQPHPAGLIHATRGVPRDSTRAPVPPSREVLDAGFTHRGETGGAGFAAGGALDQMPAGWLLAMAADQAWDAGLGSLSDDELAGLLAAARRNASRQAALELDVIGELAARRAAADGTPGEHVADEIAALLTLTGPAAARQVALAEAMTRLPSVAAALAAGRIDADKARVFARELIVLDDDLAAAAIAAALVRAAAGMTTGGLGHELRWLVTAFDPQAAARRKEKAEKDARVECWTEPAGTGAIAGRDLNLARAITADQQVDADARWLQAHGMPGTLDQLRVEVFLARLTGQPLSSLLPPTPGARASGPGTDAARPPAAGMSHRAAGAGDDGAAAARTVAVNDATGHDGADTADNVGAGPAGTGSMNGSTDHDDADTADNVGAGPAGTGAMNGTTGDDGADTGGVGPGGTENASAGGAGNGPASGTPWPAGLGGLGGSVNLTMPAQTWLGSSDAPGEAGRYGTIDAATCRDLADALAAQPAARWCVTLVDYQGRAVAHGCARAGPGPPGSDRAAWLASVTITPIETGACAHRRESAGYRPSGTLRHIVKVRSPRCGYPGCRNRAERCDDDHTIPHHKGGKTCECNLYPLCRRHHRAKQAEGWSLAQPEPGILIWTLPCGRTITTAPEPYPV